MEAPYLVSIVINNYNYGRFVQRAIDSAIAQDYSEVEVIVVDDGSTDDSRTYIEGYGDQIISIFKDNAGQTSCFNVACDVCRGEIICFLDADDFFEPTKISRVVTIFKMDPEIQWVFHTLQLFDSASNKIVALTGESSSAKLDFRQEIQSGKLRFYPPPTSGICLRQPLVTRVFPIPETFLKTSADRYIRLAATALSVGYFLDEPLATQIIHGDNIATTSVFSRALNENEIITAYLIQKKIPKIKKYCNRVFSKGVIGYIRRQKDKSQYREYINKYLSTVGNLELFMIILMIIYQGRPWKKGYSHRKV